MTPTHAISADEARRLLHIDRENQRYASALRSARAWVDAQPHTTWFVPGNTRIVTPFGTFTGEEMASLGERDGEEGMGQVPVTCAHVGCPYPPESNLDYCRGHEMAREGTWGIQVELP